MKQIVYLLVMVAALAVRAQSAPEQFTANITNGTAVVTVDFVYHPIRSANFIVYVQDATGGFNVYTNTPEARTYLGTVRGQAGALAAGTLKPDGTLLARVSFDTGVEWNTTGGAASTRGSTNWAANWPTSANIGTGGAGTNVYAAEVGVDSSYKHFQQSGLNVDTDLFIIEHSVMCANMVYLRDCGVLHRVGRIIIRGDATQCPYYALTNNLLGAVQTQWQSVITNLAPASTHDLALVASPTVGGGVAWVGVIGNSSARYSSCGTDANGDFYVVWRHEAGHNWSVLDYEANSAEGPTINCGNSLARFSGPEENKVVTQRNAKLAYLDPLGPYPFELPPHAALDLGTTEPETPVTIDLLGNDHDANGDAIHLVAVDSNSVNGASIAVVNGQAQYTPTANFPLGADRFTYRIEDALGYQALGNVFVKLTPTGDLAGHWTFDEPTGSTAYDSAAAFNNGTLNNGVRTTGMVDGAVEFNGSNTTVTAGALNLYTNTVTITCWGKRNGAQNSSAGIVFSRAGNTVAGLNFGSANELRYHWNDAANTYNFNSGLVVPDSTWTFCALVVEPSKATFYMDAGSGLQTAVNNVAHALEEFNSTLTLGQDPTSTSRSFKGTLDDVRIFRRALSAAEIQSLAAGHGTAANPQPRQGNPLATGSLAWTPPPAATAHAVYFGSSYRALRDATPASPEYKGTQTAAAYNPGTLATGTDFWRVDESNGATTFKGPVWFFNAQEHGLVLARWNNLTGTTVDALTNNAAYPNSPDAISFLPTAHFVTLGDNYGTRTHGWLTPTGTGTYTFWLATDDCGELWLSTDTAPANKVKIAAVNGYTADLQWNKYASQQSAPINLVAGQHYYIEILQKEGSGGDNMGVAWQGPGIAQQVIANAYLSPILPATLPLSLTCPGNINVSANDGCTATGINLGTATTSGGCSAITINNDAPASFPVGTTVVTWTATDSCHNTVTCQQTVTVTDTTPPAITSPATVSTVTDAGKSYASGVSLGTPVTSDNCGVASVANNAPATFPVGTNTVTWTVRDNAGNTATASQLVIVRDNQAPTAPANLSSPSQTKTAITLAWTAATDNVGVTQYLIYRGGVQVGTSTTPAFTNTGLKRNTSYTYYVKARDAAGNVSAQSNTLTVKSRP